MSGNKSDAWIASALGTSQASVQSFRSRKGIYRRTVGSIPVTPEHYSAYEGAVENGEAVWFDPSVTDDSVYRANWQGVGKVKIHITPTRIVISRR